jgi:hypothetical protein
MEKDQRLFRITDAEAKQKAKVLLTFATDDIADLNAFDNDIDANFLTDWQQAIDDADVHLTDSHSTAVLAQRTADVQLAHTQCIEAVRDLRYHAGKAFAKKSGEWALFNFKGLARARTSASRLAVYVQVLYQVADGLSAELIAKGMAPGQILALSSAAQALFNADVAQEFQKHQRLRETHQRISAMNRVWAYCQQVHRAGQIVYADDSAMYGKYALT